MPYVKCKVIHTGMKQRIEDCHTLQKAFQEIKDTYNDISKGDYISKLEKLPEKQQEVLVMKFFHEVSTTDIAQMLGIDVSAVRRRISRAEKNLYDILKEELE